jgi:hypothetical protein
MGVSWLQKENQSVSGDANLPKKFPGYGLEMRVAVDKDQTVKRRGGGDQGIHCGKPLPACPSDFQCASNDFTSQGAAHKKAREFGPVFVELGFHTEGFQFGPKFQFGNAANAWWVFRVGKQRLDTIGTLFFKVISQNGRCVQEVRHNTVWWLAFLRPLCDEFSNGTAALW